MGNYELDDEDVLLLGTPAPFLGEATTFTVHQVQCKLQAEFNQVTKSQSAHTWLSMGIDCKLLSATEGKGWRKGKIRLRLEIELEPEPEPVNNDPNSLDSLRSELYPKQ